MITAIYYAGSGHPGGSLSCVEIINAILCWRRDDVLILSKGHACPALYGAYVAHDMLSAVPGELRKIYSKLQGHPDSNRLDLIPTSTGSLGQGLAVATGLAWKHKIEGSDTKVHVIVGDGELEEGICWESIRIAKQNSLHNLIIWVDLNKFSSDSICYYNSSMADVFQAYTQYYPPTTLWMIDGHCVDTLYQLTTDWISVEEVSGPWVILCNTTKGKGVSFMENDPAWHGSVILSKDEYYSALSELGGGNGN